MGRWYSAPEERPQFRLVMPGFAPVTVAMIVVNIFTFLTTFFAQQPIWSWMWFNSDDLMARPWTLLTYPLHTPMDLLWFAFLLYVFWWVGGSLERSWGTREFGLFFGAITIITALSFAAAKALGLPVPPLAGLAMPEAALFVTWAMLNPQATVLLMFVLPIRAQYLGWATLAFVYFGYGPMLGLFALVGCLAGWWYARRVRAVIAPRYWRGQQVPEQKPAGGYSRFSDWNFLLSPLEWYTRWRRKRDFARLMKNSGFLEFDEEEEEEGRGRKGSSP